MFFIRSVIDLAAKNIQHTAYSDRPVYPLAGRALRKALQGPGFAVPLHCENPCSTNPMKWIYPHREYAGTLSTSSGKESLVFKHREELPHTFTCSMCLTPL